MFAEGLDACDAEIRGVRRGGIFWPTEPGRGGRDEGVVDGLEARGVESNLVGEVAVSVIVSLRFLGV